MTQMGSAIGTPAYMSPEQAAGQLDKLGPASDIYSLGATFYALLTGQAPFREGEGGDVYQKVRNGDFVPPRRTNAGIPTPLEAICLKAMALHPANRYASCAKLAGDIEHWLADEPVSAWPEPLSVRLQRWTRRHRTTVTSAVASLAIALAAAVLGIVLLAAAEERERKAKLDEASARQDEAAARSIAEKREAEARWNLYVAQMHLVQREYEADNISHVRELLNNWLPKNETEKDLRGFEWHYWHQRTHLELLTLEHNDPVDSVCFSPDGTLLASGSAGQAVVWDSRSGQELLTLKHPHVFSVCFSPDGTRLASAGTDHIVMVWDCESGRELLSLKHPGQVHHVCFSPDGTRLASGLREVDYEWGQEYFSSRVQWKVWDSTSGQELLTIKGDAYQ
jgi:hypothetical protein